MHEILEYLNAFSTLIIALFTLALFFATKTLANYTKSLNDHDREQKRVADIKRCIYLAESIIRSDPAELGKWYAGEVGVNAVRPFSEILTLHKYFYDPDVKRLLEQIAPVITEALIPGQHAPLLNEPFVSNLSRLKTKLTQETMELQRVLGSYQR